MTDTHRRKILVVDDDRAILDLVATRLTLAGYDVFSARDGRDAINRIQSLRPDAMVLDLSMPMLDGFGVLQQLGKDGAARLPTLVLTARHSAADVQRAISLGARDYVTKPFRDSQLLMRVQRMLRPPIERRSLEELFEDLEAMVTGPGPDREPKLKSA